MCSDAYPATLDGIVLSIFARPLLRMFAYLKFFSSALIQLTLAQHSIANIYDQCFSPEQHFTSGRCRVPANQMRVLCGSWPTLSAYLDLNNILHREGQVPGSCDATELVYEACAPDALADIEGLLERLSEKFGLSWDTLECVLMECCKRVKISLDQERLDAWEPTPNMRVRTASGVLPDIQAIFNK
jgi:hypothetical protein